MSSGEFNVFWWDSGGNQHDELVSVDARTAVYRAKHLAHGVAGKLGIVDRIIITDGDDYTTFEWLKDKGVVFPSREECAG